MRHSFRFPAHIREAVKRHIGSAVDAVNPSRFKQEHAYTTALASQLEGTAYQGNEGSVVFESTVVDDRGRSSAESWSGADLAITATISDGRESIRKAILVQAKLGSLDQLANDEYERLLGQIQDMKRLTRAPKVMEIPDSNGTRVPQMVSGNRILAGARYRSFRLADYVVARVLTTLDGDTRPQFVNGVQDSALTQFRIRAELTMSAPKPQ